jgi:hypothetical protein
MFDTYVYETLFQMSIFSCKVLFSYKKWLEHRNDASFIKSESYCVKYEHKFEECDAALVFTEENIHGKHHTYFT